MALETEIGTLSNGVFLLISLHLLVLVGTGVPILNEMVSPAIYVNDSNNILMHIYICIYTYTYAYTYTYIDIDTLGNTQHLNFSGQ